MQPSLVVGLPKSDSHLADARASFEQGPDAIGIIPFGHNASLASTESLGVLKSSVHATSALA